MSIARASLCTCVSLPIATCCAARVCCTRASAAHCCQSNTSRWRSALLLSNALAIWGHGRRTSLSAVHHELSTASALLCLTSAACPAGPKGGTYRPSTASYIYKLRCTCAVAFKCPARALIEVLCVACFVGEAGPSSMAAPATERVWFASGWPHDHGGPCLLQRGLPPTGACLFYHFGSSLLCAHDTLAVRLPLAHS